MPLYQEMDYPIFEHFRFLMFNIWTAWKKWLVDIYIIASLEHTSFLMRSYTVFEYDFTDSEYHKIYCTYYFFTFSGQRIMHFWFFYVWYKSIFKISFSWWTANNAVFCLILFNATSYISVSFLVIIQPSDEVTSFNT